MFQSPVDLSDAVSYLIQLSMAVIGSAFVMGFGVKKLLHLLKGA